MISTVDQLLDDLASQLQLIERDLYEQMYGELPFAVSIDGEVEERA